MTTAVNSIQIPREFVVLCIHWGGGQDCMLYAVSSTGNLTMGNRRPRNCDTDEKWYLSIWRSLSGDLSATLRMARKAEHSDVPDLERFDAYVDQIVERLAGEYGLEDWEE